MYGMSNENSSRYIIGVDLGTTNCAVTFLDLKQAQPEPEVFWIEQTSEDGRVYLEDHLPSFLLYPEASDADLIAGTAAKEAAFSSAGRVIHSAKSWLCYGSSVELAKILPWQSAIVPDEKKLSPVEATVRYLVHIKECWNRDKADVRSEFKLEQQTVIVTVPASFDERAQELTREALIQSGYPADTVLLEEPLSALSSVLHEQRAMQDDLLRHSRKEEYQVLVVDIGGGTTDFSLFRTKPGAHSRLDRIAVGDHLLLGGDNIDLSIAHELVKENKLEFHPSSRQWSILCARSRELKERLFAKEELSQQEHISIPSDSGNLFEGTISFEVNPEELREKVLDGFFSLPADLPLARSGLRKRGLPYESISSVPFHIKQFLQGTIVDAVIFNGGSVRPKMLRERLLNFLASEQNGYRPLEIINNHYAHAVARGAALWAYRRLIGSEQIHAGYRASIYVDLSRKITSDPATLICLCPFGMNEGERSRMEVPGLEAVVGQPVKVALARSVHRQSDSAGEIVTAKRQEFQPLPSSAVVFEAEGLSPGRIPVVMEAYLTPTGRLQLSCIYAENEDISWNLSFDTRMEESETVSGDIETVSGARRQVVQEELSRWFGKSRKREDNQKPVRLLARIEQELELPRERWSLPLIRVLSDTMIKGAGRRARSVSHERSWLRVTGYLMRPGFGDGLDSSRMDRIWPLFKQGPFFPDQGAVKVEWAIFWRRISGGLDNNRQKEIFATFFKNRVERTGIEELRLLCGLERLEKGLRKKLADSLIKALCSGKGDTNQLAACLGRLLTRDLAYGDIHSVLSPDVVKNAFEILSAGDYDKKSGSALAHAFIRAAHLTGESEIDLDEVTRKKIDLFAAQKGIAQEKRAALFEVRHLVGEEEAFLLGDTLPPGLRLAV